MGKPEDRFVRAHSESIKAAPSGSGAEPKKPVNFPYFEIMLWFVTHIRKRRYVYSCRLTKRKNIKYFFKTCVSNAQCQRNGRRR